MVFDTKFSLQSFLMQVNKLTLSQRILIEKVGFGNVLQIPNQNLRRHQLVELMERWCCEKQAFILRPGAITISLMDVALILGLRVIGDSVALNVAPFTELERDFGASVWCRRVTVASLKERLESLGEQDDENFVRSFLLFTFGTLLFPNTNGKVDSRYLILLRDLEKVSNFAWGAAVLSDLFYYLSQRKKKNLRCIGGCLILLQIWCYEHIKVCRPISLNRSFPRSCRWEKVSIAYITTHNDREVFPLLFRNLEHNQILWELIVTSEESEITLVKELLESEEYSSSDVCVDKEDNSRTNSEMVEQWVDLVTESSTDVGINEEQEDLVRQPHNAVLLLEENNDSTPSTAYHIQEVQKEQQPISCVNQEVFVISDDDEGGLDARSETLEEQIIKLKSKYEKQGKEIIELKLELDNLRRESSLSTDRTLDHARSETLEEQYIKLKNENEEQRKEIIVLKLELDNIRRESSLSTDRILDHARSETLEEQNIKLKNENEEQGKEIMLLKLELDNLRKSSLSTDRILDHARSDTLEEKYIKLENEYEEQRKKIIELSISKDRILDRLEKIALGEDVDSVLASGKCNSEKQL